MNRVGQWKLRGRREAYTEFWWGKLKGMMPFRKPRSRWRDNIKVGLKESVNRAMHWIYLFQIRKIGGVL